jgi:hypothetical protein
MIVTLGRLARTPSINKVVRRCRLAEIDSRRAALLDNGSIVPLRIRQSQPAAPYQAVRFVGISALIAN